MPLKEHEVTIFVRRGGPNYQEGLRVMGEVGMFVICCKFKCIFYCLFDIIGLILKSFPFRKDDWDPDSCLWHRNPHDCHCWHGSGSQANPQPASCCCPHCQLPPQHQQQLIGTMHTGSLETNRLMHVISLCLYILSCFIFLVSLRSKQKTHMPQPAFQFLLSCPFRVPYY